MSSSGKCSRPVGYDHSHVALVDPRHQPATEASGAEEPGPHGDETDTETGLAVGSGAAGMIPPTSGTALSMCSHRGRCWWARRDSNPRLLPCKWRSDPLTRDYSRQLVLSGTCWHPCDRMCVGRMLAGGLFASTGPALAFCIMKAPRGAVVPRPNGWLHSDGQLVDTRGQDSLLLYRATAVLPPATSNG